MALLHTADMLDYADRREFMKVGTALLIAALWSVGAASAQKKRRPDAKKPNGLPSVLTYDDVRAVSPALEHYTKGALLNGLWKRPELSPRDRSVVTVAALIARIQTIEMPFHFSLALDNGVKPSEPLRDHYPLSFLLRMGKREVRGKSFGIMVARDGVEPPTPA